MKPEDLSSGKLLGGAGFAARALGIATLLTVSGFGILLVGVSALLEVNTPKQFGARMKNTFGDRYRINKNSTSENYETLTELFEAANKTSKTPNS
jgi:hypothetical protein